METESADFIFVEAAENIELLNTSTQCKGDIFFALSEGTPIKNESDFTELDVCDAEECNRPSPHSWLRKRFYVLSWIRHYDQEKAMSDFIAGITLGLTIIPQSLAYAALAGLTPEYGLYSAFVGSIVYVFFGTIAQVSIGPTSLMALLVFEACADKPKQLVVVLAFLAGLVELLMGVLKLGMICSFISNPVTKAFTSGTATLITLVQLKSMLGIDARGFPSLSKILHGVQMPDTVLGLICTTALLLLRQLSEVNLKRQNANTRCLKKLLWYISISRNAIVVFICAAITYIWSQQSSVPYKLTSEVRSGMPSFSLPPFAFEHNNRTYIFTDICRELGASIIVVPLVATLANVAIAKAFVKDGSLDASQEMIALGICNLSGSFFGAMPTCGAFTRSAVSNASGVRTPMAGIYTGFVVLSALGILTPYFQYIPKSTLAAVLISAVIYMIELHVVLDYWRNNKKDFLSWIGCFTVCVFSGVELGLLAGVTINMTFILLQLGNPKVSVALKEVSGQRYLHVVPYSDIYYTGIDRLRDEIRSACAMYNKDFPLVLNCSRFMHSDATFADMLIGMDNELSEKGVIFILQEMNNKIKKQISHRSSIRFCEFDICLEDLALKC